MIASEAVRAARKKAHLARIKEKKGKDYPAFYAAQPLQLVKAKTNAEIAAARQAAKDAAETLALAEITGENLAMAQERAAVAALVVEKMRAQANRRLGAALSAGGAT
jgi:hypothetical protein